MPPASRRRPAAIVAAIAASTAIGSLLSGCGSVNELPPAAGPAESPPASSAAPGRVGARLTTVGGGGGDATLARGRVRVEVLRRERVLVARSGEREIARAPAGIGPTNVVTDGENLAYVVDTTGDALLVFRLRPRLEITRRVHVPGAPYGIAIDRDRDLLWVTATARNELVRLTADGRPRPLARVRTIRQPNQVVVDAGRVVVMSPEQIQVLDPP